MKVGDPTEYVCLYLPLVLGNRPLKCVLLMAESRVSQTLLYGYFKGSR